jgi:hypothetical protein
MAPAGSGRLVFAQAPESAAAEEGRGKIKNAPAEKTDLSHDRPRRNEIQEKCTAPKLLS